MTFTKNLDNLEFSDIKSLLDNKISESDILDYKECMIEDGELIKHVSAFANTHGGHIIFGIKESGKGGHPVLLNGLDPKEINKERIEQVILSNIFPRLQIKLKTIDNENNNQFLIMQIPDSSFKPHFDNKSQRFYKRFDFGSLRISEQEISDMYKNRFHTFHDVKEYLQNIIANFPVSQILQVQIVVIPTRLNPQLIDTTDPDISDTLNPNHIDYSPSGWAWAPRHSFLRSFVKPHKFGLTFNDEKTSIFVHRNGSIQYVSDVGYETNEQPNTVFIQYPILALRIMHVLQFAEDVLSRYNYFGDVEILVKLSSAKRTWSIKWGDWSSDYATFESDKTLMIERDYPVMYLKTNYSKITSSIMDEIYNCFEIWKCPLFDKNGQYITKNFDR